MLLWQHILKYLMHDLRKKRDNDRQNRVIKPLVKVTERPYFPQVGKPANIGNVVQDWVLRQTRPRQMRDKRLRK